MLSYLISLVFFLANGEAAFVLPHYNNTVYISIGMGDNFGHLDIQGSIGANVMSFKLKDLDLSFKFTVQALLNCDLLALSIEDMDSMKLEFPNVYIDLFKNADRLYE